MVSSLSGNRLKSVWKIVNDAEDVYMGQEILGKKYCGGTGVFCLDNPIPWKHGPHGFLSNEEFNPSLYRKIIQELRKKFNGVKPISFNDTFKKLTGVSYPPKASERRNDYFDDNAKRKFPGKTDDEIVALYIVDRLKLREKCNTVIKKLEKLIKDAET